MKKILIAAALLSAVSPAIAGERSTFTHNGVKYTYSVKQLSDSKRVITGWATPGSSFRLTVSGERVSGVSNGMPVSFDVADAVGSAANGSVTVASR